MKQADKAQFWREQSDSWPKSDVAQRRYCEDNSLSYSSFTYSRGKQAASKIVASKCLPIKVTVPSSTISIIFQATFDWKSPRPRWPRYCPLSTVLCEVVANIAAE